MKTGRRLTALALTALLLLAFTMDGLAVDRAPAPSGCDVEAVLVNIDICGHDTPDTSWPHICYYADDLAVSMPGSPVHRLESLRHVPPIPESVIALADPRDIEKPPEVYPLS